jgi:hypothetical protein
VTKIAETLECLPSLRHLGLSIYKDFPHLLNGRTFSFKLASLSFYLSNDTQLQDFLNSQPSLTTVDICFREPTVRPKFNAGYRRIFMAPTVKVIAITSETRRSPLGDLIDSDLFVLSTAKFKIHDRLRLPMPNTHTATGTKFSLCRTFDNPESKGHLDNITIRQLVQSSRALQSAVDHNGE